MNKQDALMLCRQLEIDRWVRTVARSGLSDEARCNFSAEWDSCEVSASVAGTCTAKVLAPDGSILYRGHDFGRHIEIYHHGPWAARFIEYADNERVKSLQEDNQRQAEKALQEATAYEPTDF